MKWLILAGFLVVCLPRYSEGGALRCTPGTQDPSCLTERIEILLPIQISKEESVKGTTSADVECLIGTEWESNCHYCRCSDSGVAECLKQDTCDNGVFAEPISCKPNTTFQKDCNTCMCLENGLGLCTLEFCRSLPKPNMRCAPGTFWKNDCNTCWCLPEGIASCTKADCLNDNNMNMVCAPDSVWKDDCNTCRCTADGLPMCTKINCVSINEFEMGSTDKLEKSDIPKPNATLSRKVRAFPQEPLKTCLPGTEFRMDCNKCLCDNEGQNFSCTRIDCNAVNNNHASTLSKREISEKVAMKCVPGSVFDQGCNVCRCTQDGNFATCSIRRCSQQNDVDANLQTDSDPGFRCNPGEQFKRDCNDCTCSADGKSVFCTLRLCDQNLTPDI